MLIQIRTESEWMVAAANHIFVGIRLFEVKVSTSASVPQITISGFKCGAWQWAGNLRRVRWGSWVVYLCVDAALSVFMCPCWYQEGVKRRAIIAVSSGKLWLAILTPPIDPHYSCINGRPAGLDCHHREWKHMQLEMHPRDTEGPPIMTKLSAPARVYLQNFKTF